MNPYANYLGERSALETIASTPAELRRLLASGGQQTAAPGKWTAREILCHLADCEIVFAFRLRQALAEEHHTIQPFDQDAWASTYSGYETAAALGVFEAVRGWNLAFIKSAGPEAMTKMLNHPERGEMTFQTVVETMGGHDINHLEQLYRLFTPPA